MEKQESKWQNLADKLKSEYRLSILQEETFEQLTNYKLALWKMIGTVIGTGILIILGTLAIVIYTPLKGPILNYVTQIETTDIVVLNQTIDSLEQQIVAHETYQAAMRKILLGGVDPEGQPTNPDAVNSAPATSSPMAVEEPVTIQPRTIRMSSRPTSTAIGNLTPPITGSISAQFMPDKGHYGVDIIAPKNTPVKAIMDGYVIAADWTIDTGNTIGIQHINGYVSFYKHNSSLLKKAGSPVKAGEAIAIIGNTGRLTDGPHLHFELWHHGQAINPIDYINF